MKNTIVGLVLIALSGYLIAFDSNLVVVETLTKTSKSWDGSTLPAYNSGQPEITILKITVQPNVELPWHTHPVINAGIMTKGVLTVVTKDGEENELHAGDTIVEVMGKIHRGINKGTEPAEIIVVYAGVTETPVTIITE